jgi:hypothetical protein
MWLGLGRIELGSRLTRDTGCAKDERVLLVGGHVVRRSAVCQLMIQSCHTVMLCTRTYDELLQIFSTGFAYICILCSGMQKSVTCVMLLETFVSASSRNQLIQS